MPPVPQKKGMTILTRSRTSSDSSIPSLKTPRTPRFAEATAVNSPIDGPTKAGKSPFDDPPEATTTHFKPQPQPSDVGFGYISDNNPTHQVAYVPMDEEKRGMASPLKSAMKVPGSARKMDNPLSPSFQEPSILSPTWKEEKAVEEAEKKNDIDQAKDIVSSSIPPATPIRILTCIATRKSKPVYGWQRWFCAASTSAAA